MRHQRWPCATHLFGHRLPMMFHSASPVGREEGCPITTSVARPCPKPGSPPHDTMADDGEEVALLFPHVIDDLREAARQGDARHFLAPPLLHRVEPRPQGPGPARGLGGGEHQGPAQQAVAFLTDVAGANPVGAGSDAGSQTDVAGDLLRVGKATDVTELEEEHDGDERADAGNRRQPLDSRIGPPLLSEFGVEMPDLAVEESQQGTAVLADPARDRGQRQALELAVPARGEPALARGRLEIAAGEQGNHAIADLAADPRELNTVTDELAGLAQSSRGNPDGGKQVAAQQKHQAVGIDAIVLESGARDRPGLFRVREDGLMAEAREKIHEPPPPGGFDRHRSLRRELRKKPPHALDVVDESMPCEFAVLREDRNLRRAFMQIDAPRVASPWPPVSEWFGRFSEEPAYFRLG